MIVILYKTGNQQRLKTLQEILGSKKETFSPYLALSSKFIILFCHLKCELALATVFCRYGTHPIQLAGVSAKLCGENSFTHHDLEKGAKLLTLPD